MTSCDVIVIGAGAAGLMAAMTAGQRGRRVCVLEHTSGVGAKILISGGGRCNFTNRRVGIDNFLSANPNFARSALARYTPQDFIALVERHGIAYYEKTLGQLFCEGAGQARAIVAMLMRECADAGVTVTTGAAVADVARAADGWRVAIADGSHWVAPSLIVATGGLSIPKMGATSFAYELAERFGLAIEPTRPALVPFTLDDAARARFAPLAGVSAPIAASARTGPRFAEALLVTHRGLSGPAILQASSYWRPGEAVRLDFDPDRAFAERLLALKRERPKITVRSALALLYPARLAALFADAYADGGERTLADARDQSLRDLNATLSDLAVTPAGTEGYAKAEVTAGGVSTADLSSKTMEARTVPGLFFVGEAVDVTGWLGGYNFQWAWSSGWAAGQAV